jgi:hypothetical protein
MEFTIEVRRRIYWKTFRSRCVADVAAHRISWQRIPSRGQTLSFLDWGIHIHQTTSDYMAP